MTGYWVLGTMVAYTALLIYLGQSGRKRMAGSGSFFSGGSSFGILYIVACVSAFWGSATFVAVLELAYTKGVSAAWYGVATMVMVATIGFVLVPKYKSMQMVTFSGVLGDKYGRTVRAISSLIIGLTFPMFSIANVVGASAVLTVALGWPIWLSVIVTSAIILAYVLLGGMYAVGLAQLLNLVTMYVGMALAVGVVGVSVGFAAFGNLPASYTAPMTVGFETVMVWTFNFVTNAVIAQAVIQMIMACKDTQTGRKGTAIAIIGIVPLTVIPVLLGLAAAIAVPGANKGLIAFAQFIMTNAPAPVAAIVFLSVWAAALAWGGPCQFSGGTSLGKDFVQSLKPQATDEELVRYGGYATALLTLVLIVYGFMRSEQAAWWNIFAFNLRNSAIFAPTIAAMVWPVASRKGTVLTMLIGASSGFVWYYLGNFNPAQFFCRIHPMWIGMSVGILSLIVASLIEQRDKVVVQFSEGGARFGILCLILTVACFYSLFTWTNVLQAKGLLGNVIFLSAMGLFALAIIFTHFRKEGKGMARGTAIEEAV